MAPKKSILVEGGPAELFTTTHAAEFEAQFDLPPGAVTCAYQVRFGPLAPYVLRELTDVRPTIDTQGNIIWPPVSTLKRRNATAGFIKRRPQVFPSIQDSSPDDDDEFDSPTPILGGPGLKRSTAIRRRQAIPSSLAPVPLQRRGAMRKAFNPVRSLTKRRGQRKLDGLSLSSLSSAGGSNKSSPIALRRSTRSGRGSLGLSRGSRQTTLTTSPKQPSPRQGTPRKINQSGFSPYHQET